MSRSPWPRSRRLFAKREHPSTWAMVALLALFLGLLAAGVI